MGCATQYHNTNATIHGVKIIGKICGWIWMKYRNTTTLNITWGRLSCNNANGKNSSS